VGNGTGVGVVAVYEVDHTEIPLINISTRGRVLTGNDVMIGGFIIQGTGPQQVAIVATGPSLAAVRHREPARQSHAHAGALVRPGGARDQRRLAERGECGGAADCRLRADQPPRVGDPRHTASGAYTAILSGAGGGTGVGVIGVYTVD
jgi:hypothetical protein